MCKNCLFRLKKLRLIFKTILKYSKPFFLIIQMQNKNQILIKFKINYLLYISKKVFLTI